MPPRSFFVVFAFASPRPATIGDSVLPAPDRTGFGGIAASAQRTRQHYGIAWVLQRGFRLRGMGPSAAIALVVRLAVLLAVLTTAWCDGPSTRPHGFKTVPTRAGRVPTNRRHVASTTPPIVFPRSSELRPLVDGSGKPSCAATGFRESAYCVDDDSYPTQAIKSILRRVNVDLSDHEILARQPLDREDSIDQRVCKTKRKTIYPKSARNADKEWLYVVNDVEYAQAVTVEVCAQEESPCEFVSSGLPPGYSSACRQKFAYRKLLAVHPTEKKAVADNFPFPACCVCYVKAPPLAARSLPRRP